MIKLLKKKSLFSNYFLKGKQTKYALDQPIALKGPIPAEQPRGKYSSVTTNFLLTT